MILTVLFIFIGGWLLIKSAGGIYLDWFLDAVLELKDKEDTKKFIEETKKEADTKDKDKYNFRWDV